jgi:zinc protease
MHHFSFKNGLELLVHQNINLKNTVLNLLYKVGSAQEDSSQTGLAHFLEHMMFEGSQKYHNFDESLQAMMAENNAFTGQDYTCYYESFPTKFLNEVLAIEADRMFYLDLKKSSVDIQAKVIQEEYKETCMNPPLSDVWHHLQKLCFKNSYQWPVIGKSLKHVASTNKSILSSFYKKYYTPENAIISIVTPLEATTVVDMVKKAFETDLLKKNTLVPKEVLSSYSKIGKKQLKRTNIATPSFFMAFHIEDFASKEYFLSDMASDLLTNGESSLLYRALVIDSKLCTEIQSYTTDNINCNLLIIEGKLTSGKCFENVYIEIDKVFTEFKSQSISKKRYEILYNKALTYWSFYHYSSSQLAQNMAIFYQAQGVTDLPTFIEDTYNSISINDFNIHLKSLLDIKKASIVEYMPK